MIETLKNAKEMESKDGQSLEGNSGNSFQKRGVLEMDNGWVDDPS